jgi:hypothetical protein
MSARKIPCTDKEIAELLWKEECKRRKGNISILCPECEYISIYLCPCAEEEFYDTITSRDIERAQIRFYKLDLANKK